MSNSGTFAPCVPFRSYRTKVASPRKKSMVREAIKFISEQVSFRLREHSLFVYNIDDSSFAKSCNHDRS
jgi:hypothetical protein